MSVPLHTGLVGGITTREELNLSTDISFDDFTSQVCTKMDLEPQNAVLGYKFNKDRRRDPYLNLTNADQLRAAMAKGADLIERARTRRVVLEIQNLVRPYLNIRHATDIKIVFICSNLLARRLLLLRAESDQRRTSKSLRHRRTACPLRSLDSWMLLALLQAH